MLSMSRTILKNLDRRVSTGAYLPVMGKKIKVTRIIDVTEMGRRGGLQTAANRSPELRREISARALKARWDAYYRANPEKLKAKKARERKKARVVRS